MVGGRVVMVWAGGGGVVMPLINSRRRRLRPPIIISAPVLITGRRWLVMTSRACTAAATRTPVIRIISVAARLLVPLVAPAVVFVSPFSRSVIILKKISYFRPRTNKNALYEFILDRYLPMLYALSIQTKGYYLSVRNSVRFVRFYFPNPISIRCLATSPPHPSH